MANLNELGLVDEPVAVNIDDLPEPMGGMLPLPQPGTYRFRIPTTVAECYEAYQTTDRGQRVRAVFEGEHALTILPSGQPFRARISNQEREIKKKLVSDMAFLLSDGFGVTGSLPNSAAYIAALNQQAGKEFIADIEWQTNCSVKRDVFKEGKVQTGVKGCGTIFAMRSYPRKDGTDVYQIPKDSKGAWVEEFTCPKCSAIVRSFGQLNRFQAAK